jgi:hypothetical protein
VKDGKIAKRRAVMPEWQSWAFRYFSWILYQHRKDLDYSSLAQKKRSLENSGLQESILYYIYGLMKNKVINCLPEYNLISFLNTKYASYWMFSIYSCEFCLSINSNKASRKTIILVYMATFVVKIFTSILDNSNSISNGTHCIHSVSDILCL